MTAVEVRDSSRMRTKSLRIALLGELLDDAGAGRAAGDAGRDHGLAERLQRARDVHALAAGHRGLLDARWRRPSRKFGTASVLSIAALRVTVMIIRRAAARAVLRSRRRRSTRRIGCERPARASRGRPSTDQRGTRHCTRTGDIGRGRAPRGGPVAPRRPARSRCPPACPRAERPSSSSGASTRTRSPPSTVSARRGAPPARGVRAERYAMSPRRRVAPGARARATRGSGPGRSAAARACRRRARPRWARPSTTLITRRPAAPAEPTST